MHERVRKIERLIEKIKEFKDNKKVFDIATLDMSLGEQIKYLNVRDINQVDIKIWETSQKANEVFEVM